MRVCAAILLVAFAAAPAAADHRPVVLPNGAVVHGDWGLHRPGHIVPYVDDAASWFYGAPAYGYYFAPSAYFPSNKGDPHAYRTRRTWQPTQPGARYQRTWSTNSNTPADLNAQPPLQGPIVIPAPNGDK
ncbi:MAG: hypothetical protein KF794_08975 [Xanthobacteraceae bacterium]|nr:hypothetical protein [Xanthobacteraceae bacterium]QYK43935.1 MAG: hypothetical protein KF794_08975 [Xanthobacteraceae bacterium]